MLIVLAGEEKTDTQQTWLEAVKTPEIASTATTARAITASFSAAAPRHFRAAGAGAVAP